MITDHNQLAKEIIEKNQYLALSTFAPPNNTWTSVVCYSYDKDFNFYFVSLPFSKHIENIEKNNNVTFAIYDSTQKWGYGVGLQIEGKVEKTNPILASKNYFLRKYPYGDISNSFALAIKKLLKNKTYSFYKITPTKIWLNNPDAEIDERVEVNL